MTDVDTVDGSEILHPPGMYTKNLVNDIWFQLITVPSTWWVYRISEPSTVWHSLGNPPNSWYGKLSHYIKGFITQVVGLGISEPSTPFTGTNPKPPMQLAAPLQTSVRLDYLRQVRRQLLGVRETLEVAQRRMEVRNGLVVEVLFFSQGERGWFEV